MLRFLASIENVPGSEPPVDLAGTVAKFLSGSVSNNAESDAFPELGLRIAWLGSASQQQLLWNESRDICLLWRGELFHDPGDLGPLALRHSSPSQLGSFILQQYEKSGSAGLSALNGSFSGLIVDRVQHRITVYNDRFGLNRVYFHENASGFFFASEAKALFPLFERGPELDHTGLGEWLSCGCVLQDRTLFQGIHILPGASCWEFTPGGAPKKRSYFSPGEWTGQPELSPAGYETQLNELFPTIVRRYFTADQPLGLSLTGGLDGRMVIAFSPRACGELPCYTFNGPVRDCADLRLARRIAAAAGQPHHTISIGADFFERFPDLARQSVEISDGSMDVTGAAELYANQFARQIAPVRLTGNYGSEIVRGNIAFRAANRFQNLFVPEIATGAARAVATYQHERNSAPPGARSPDLAFIAFKQVPWHHYARWSIEQSQLTVRSPFLDNDLVKLMFQAPVSSVHALEPSLRLIANGNPALGRIPTDRGVTWPASPLRNNLYRRYHDFWARAEYAWDYGMPHWLARADRTLTPLHLDKLFLGRQKFCHFRTWYRHQLAPFVRDTLLGSRALNRGYLEPKMVKRVVENHLRGTHNHTTEIHKLLSLELLHRSLLDQQ